jgi:hypothetical protein
MKEEDSGTVGPEELDRELAVAPQEFVVLEIGLWIPL